MKQELTRSWAALGARGEAPFAELMQRWREPHRHYHDLTHLEECLAWRARVEGSPELTLALWFHDAVYEPRRHDNEAASAALFERHARAASIPSERSARVCALVLSTATHDAHEGEAALLGDIDLAILSAPPARFARFEHDVRREYAHVGDAAYRLGRARVLRGFLERLAIYRTPAFEHLEGEARRNLTRALASLG